MAIARPIRALALAAVLMWCFFLYQIFKPAAPVRGPGEQFQNLERDPNLDREPSFSLS
jgi:mannosyltransferase